MDTHTHDPGENNYHERWAAVGLSRIHESYGGPVPFPLPVGVAPIDLADSACGACGGEGSYEFDQYNYMHGHYTVTETCIECDGTGRYVIVCEEHGERPAVATRDDMAWCLECADRAEGWEP